MEAEQSKPRHLSRSLSVVQRTVDADRADAMEVEFPFSCRSLSLSSRLAQEVAWSQPMYGQALHAPSTVTASWQSPLVLRQPGVHRRRAAWRRRSSRSSTRQCPALAL